MADAKDGMGKVKLYDTIDWFARVKKGSKVDSPSWSYANRMLTMLRYTYADAGGLIEELDRDWGTTIRCPEDSDASPSPDQPPKVLQLRRAESPGE